MYEYAKAFIVWYFIPTTVSFIGFYFIDPALPIWLTLTIMLITLGFIMAYGAKYLTSYLVKIYGPEVESNPTVRKMYETNDFTAEKIAYLIMMYSFFINIMLALLHVAPGAVPFSFAVGFSTFTTRNFIHDYLIYQRRKKTL